MENETVRAMTDGQRSDIIATMVTAMPTLNFDQAQAIIGNKGLFVADIGAVFKRNTGKPVPVTQALITEFTIGGRKYELVPFLKEGESLVRDVVVERAIELNAKASQDDGEFILARQVEIPTEFCGEFYLFFTDWRHPSNPQDVAYLNWNGHNWRQGWYLHGSWGVRAWLVRRRT